MDSSTASDGGYFETLLERYGVPWLALAYDCCGDRHLAEDVLAEALVNLHYALLKGEVENLEAWMTTTIRRRASDRVRKESAQRRLRDGLTEKRSTKTSQAENDADFDESFIAEPRDWQAIKEALPSLPERQRDVIRLRLFEKLSPAEVAIRLECTESAVYAAQHKAIGNLRKIISGEKKE